MANSEVTRRQLLMSLCAPAIATVKPETAHPIPSKFPSKPEFWFGDTISYPWFSADENKIHWETGEVMGVIWHSEEEEWLYTIQWTGSTHSNTSFQYPNFDEYPTDGRDFKLVAKG
jgi:hypothetical protein